MKISVIYNPYAGRWNAQKRLPEVTAALQAAGLNYQIVMTKGPGDATELAMKAVQEGCDAVIAAGGDGTISEVVNGLCKASLEKENGAALKPAGIQTPLGILPLGSANDLVVNLGLPRDIPSAVAVLAELKKRTIDLGYVSYGPSHSSHFFDNNSAIGLEPSITLIQQKITFLHGSLRYLLATLIGVMRNPQWNMQLEWDGGSYQGPATLVTVGNCPVTGGLFYMTPHADPADGKLTFVHGYMRTRLDILRLLPRTMKPGAGSYVEHPSIHEVHSTWLRIHCDQPTPLHADGEIQTDATQDIEYRILPAALSVLFP
jgi:diacylglycerol kinase (ATP)